MTDENMPQTDQVALWNGTAGQAWVEEQELLDSLFRPIERSLAQWSARLGPGQVLDVGCGTGSTTLAAARACGDATRCIGIDISEPMISLARRRAATEGARADFVQADAQQYPFAPQAFDLIMSRFGVMFFTDPAKAFANLRAALRQKGEMIFYAWRGPQENPFMTTAERAARPFLPHLPERLPGAPGQFAFGERDHVRSVLADSGWAHVEIEPYDFECIFPAALLERYFTRMGPLPLVLDQCGEPARARIVDAVRAAFEPFLNGSAVRFDAACWQVSARPA